MSVFPGITSDAPVTDPILAEVGRVRLVWHARRLRGSRSLKEAATLCGLNRDELSRIENGQTTQIRFTTLAKLLDGYQCDLADLVEIQPAQDAAEAPLYSAAVAALSAGAVAATGPRRRAVRRSSEETLPEADEMTFASSAPAPARHRRSAVGTAVR